ncbi:MAG TPA: hypothetical protein VGC84_14805, partial [Ilumatobacteraceae bacterium]
VSVLGAVAFVATDGLAAFVAAPAAGFLGDLGRRAAKPFVPSKEAEQARRDVSVQSNRVQLSAALVEWQTSLSRELALTTDALTTPAAAHAELLRERIERYAEWVAALRSGAGELSAALSIPS